MPKPPSRWPLSFVSLVVVVVASAAGCGTGAEGDTDETQVQSRLTASQSFLVSFTGGGIPANASSLVAAAGGTIVARYNMVGAVLAGEQ